MSEGRVPVEFESEDGRDSLTGVECGRDVGVALCTLESGGEAASG